METGFCKSNLKQVLRRHLQRYIPFFPTSSGRTPGSQSAGAREPNRLWGNHQDCCKTVWGSHSRKPLLQELSALARRTISAQASNPLNKSQRRDWQRQIFLNSLVTLVCSQGLEMNFPRICLSVISAQKLKSGSTVQQGRLRGCRVRGGLQSRRTWCLGNSQPCTGRGSAPQQ